MSETPARDGMLDFALAAFKDSPNPVVAAHANKLADAFEAEVRAPVPSAPVDRPAILREAADICDEAGAVYASKELNDQAGAAYRLMERFLRKADEAEYVATPCSVGACEPGGEPCSTHERLMAHAEGDHELCEPDCGTSPSRVADEAQQTDGAPCDRCKGTGVDPENSASETCGDFVREVPEPCSACQLTTPTP